MRKRKRMLSAVMAVTFLLSSPVYVFAGTSSVGEYVPLHSAEPRILCQELQQG